MKPSAQPNRRNANCPAKTTTLFGALAFSVLAAPPARADSLIAYEFSGNIERTTPPEAGLVGEARWWWRDPEDPSNWDAVFGTSTGFQTVLDSTYPAHMWDQKGDILLFDIRPPAG